MLSKVAFFRPHRATLLKVSLHSTALRQLSVDNQHSRGTSKTPDTTNSRLEQPLTSALGVFRENEADDVNALVNNFTSPALARALREREATLQSAAALAEQENWSELNDLLFPFRKSNVERRRRKNHEIDFSTTNGLSRRELVILQRYLHRMPRQIFKAVERRASVVIPLCNVNGVASVLFERRSSTVRTHKQQGGICIHSLN